MQARFSDAVNPLKDALKIAHEQHRTLLLVQGERLHGQLLAAGGDWASAETIFSENLEKASDLGLVLEIARSQAAWGMAALQFSPRPEEGYQRLALARTTFEACHAKADLATLP